MKKNELMDLARIRIRGGYDFFSDFLFSLDDEGDHRNVSLERAIDFFDKKPDTVTPSAIVVPDDEYRKRLKLIGM
jgi:hypothetical protein